ncbi:MAG: (Fe-S)-binding protein [Dehalococcoidales bacterium]|nr:(Fe-S)-binding protein [Dehalococcoidales bacterium]
MSPISMSYLGIPGYVIFWVLFALAVGLFLRRMYQLLRYMLLGQSVGGFGHLVKRVSSTIVRVFGQWCQLQNLTAKNRASLGHVFMAWGFFIFIPFYLIFIIIGGGLGLSETLEHTSFFFYYAWVMDIAAPFIMLGALWAIIRRYVIRPPRLKGEQTFEALVILVTVFIHPLTHLFKEATGIALGYAPVGLGTHLPPISQALSNLFDGASQSSIQAANTAFFWAHWGFVLFVLVFIAYSRYLHMIASMFNVLLQSPPPKGALRPIDLEKAESFGAAKITDFNRKQLLDLYSCVIYGQCQEVCPATASGKALNPKKLIDDLKEHLLTEGPGLLKGGAPAKAMIGEVITQEVIWACTTCRACQEACPVAVEHVEKIIDMRRNLVMEQASIPETAEGALRSIEDRGHPWRGTTLSRTDWAKGLEIKVLADDKDVDILFWVGCTGALEERSTQISRATAKLLKAAGVNFGILGTEESCCGEPARRLGNEYLFQMQAEKNIGLLKNYGVKRIVTACPHGYHTLKNEYPQFGGKFEVIHHTQLIARLIKEGKLKVNNSLSELVTYHDACYLGRYNDIYQPPRRLVKAIPGIKMVEMERNKENSFCCGGGGGHMWLEEHEGRRIN